MPELQAIHSLMLAVVQMQDIDLVTHALREVPAPVTHLSSTGGFLGKRNATLLVGLPDGLEEQVLKVIEASCRQRVEYLAIPLEGSPLPMPTPVPVTVGGATIFTIAVERYEEL